MMHLHLEGTLDLIGEERVPAQIAVSIRVIRTPAAEPEMALRFELPESNFLRASALFYFDELSRCAAELELLAECNQQTVQLWDTDRQCFSLRFDLVPGEDPRVAMSGEFHELPSPGAPIVEVGELSDRMMGACLCIGIQSLLMSRTEVRKLAGLLGEFIEHTRDEEPRLQP